VDGPSLAAQFNTPSDIVVDRNQQLFVADTDNARIRRISKQGAVSTVAAIGGGDGNIENFPHGLAFDQKGAMYILQSGLRHQIFQVSLACNSTCSATLDVSFVLTSTRLTSTPLFPFLV
jgi:DNA-binding beta-propeller fold protein YncE